jgi:hypothetical protein
MRNKQDRSSTLNYGNGLHILKKAFFEILHIFIDFMLACYKHTYLHIRSWTRVMNVCVNAFTETRESSLTAPCSKLSLFSPAAIHKQLFEIPKN